MGTGKRLKIYNGLPVIELGEPFYLLEPSGGVRRLMMTGHDTNVVQEAVPRTMNGLYSYPLPHRICVRIECEQMDDTMLKESKRESS